MFIGTPKCVRKSSSISLSEGQRKSRSRKPSRALPNRSPKFVKLFRALAEAFCGLALLCAFAVCAFAAFGAVIVAGNTFALVFYDWLVWLGLWRPLAGLISLGSTVLLVYGGIYQLDRYRRARHRRAM